MKKKLLSVLLSTAMVASLLVGCGSSAATDDSAAFMGMGMAGQAGGMNAQNLFQMGQQQQMQQQQILLMTAQPQTTARVQAKADLLV